MLALQIANVDGAMGPIYACRNRVMGTLLLLCPLRLLPQHLWPLVWVGILLTGCWELALQLQFVMQVSFELPITRALIATLVHTAILTALLAYPVCLVPTVAMQQPLVLHVLVGFTLLFQAFLVSPALEVVFHPPQAHHASNAVLGRTV